MKKINIITVLTMCIACPAFATGIDADNTDPDCNNATLGTYVGPTTLKAEWNANRITLNWYEDSNATTPMQVQNTSTTCVYDDGITLPTTPTKTGYQFAGWAVRQSAPAQTTFNLSTLANNVETNGLYKTSKNFAGDYCYYYNEDTSEEIEDETCTESRFTGLDNGEWLVNFNYGTVKGIIKCSATNGTWATAGTPSDTNGQYCWCQATDFAERNSSVFAPVSFSSWVFSGSEDDAVGCAYNCASLCTDTITYNPVGRSALYGIKE